MWRPGGTASGPGGVAARRRFRAPGYIRARPPGAGRDAPLRRAEQVHVRVVSHVRFTHGSANPVLFDVTRARKERSAGAARDEGAPQRARAARARACPPTPTPTPPRLPLPARVCYAAARTRPLPPAFPCPRPSLHTHTHTRDPPLPPVARLASPVEPTVAPRPVVRVRRALAAQALPPRVLPPTHPPPPPPLRPAYTPDTRARTRRVGV